MLNRDHHECFDQVFEDNLTRHGLRSLDRRLDVQLREGRANGRGARGRGPFFLQVRVAFVKLPDLAERAPPEVAVPGFPHIEVRELLEASRGIELRGQLMGKPLVLHETVLPSRLNRLLVKALGVEIAPFDAGDLSRHQRMLIGECGRTVFGPLAQLFPMRRQEIAPRHLLVLGGFLTERCNRQRGIVKVVEHLDMNE